MKRRMLAGAVMVASAALGGCSTIEVPDRLRTNNDAFDGVWIGQITADTSIQLADTRWNNQSTFFCEALEAVIELRVGEGVLKGFADFQNQAEFTANIADDGRFYAEVPRDSIFLTDGRERFGAKEFHVFSGRINPLVGSFRGVYQSAFGDMSEGGCTYRVEYMRVATDDQKE